MFFHPTTSKIEFSQAVLATVGLLPIFERLLFSSSAYAVLLPVQDLRMHITDSLSYYNHLRRRLLQSKSADTEKQLAFRYLEMGSLFSHAYSIYGLQNLPNRLQLRVWHPSWENDSFPPRDYDLDRIWISDHPVMLSPEQSILIHKLQRMPLEQVETQSAVLDGTQFEFHQEGTTVKWHLEEEITPALQKLTQFLRVLTIKASKK